MARHTPFSFNFSSPQGVNENKKLIRNSSKLISLSVFVEDDKAGPILINVHVLVEGQKHQLGQPTGIYDGEGSNAKRFDWQGILPLSLILGNDLIIQHTNYSGAAIELVRCSGVVER